VSNEVFRFVSLRPPRTANGAVNRVLLYSPDNPSRFHIGLRSLRAEGAPRSRFEAHALGYIDSGQFVVDGQPLPVALDTFAEWLSGRGPALTTAELLDQVELQLGAPLPELLSSDGYLKTRMRAADSLMASVVRPSERPAARGALLSMMQTAGLLERLPDHSGEQVDLRQAMDALLVLPGDAFPLPPAEDRYLEQRKEEARKRRERHQEAQKTVKDLATRLQQLKFAANEIAAAYSADTNDARRGPAITGSPTPAVAATQSGPIVLPPGERSPMAPVLTSTRAAALTRMTRDLLEPMSISPEFVDVHHAATVLEREIAAVSERLFNGRSYTTLVRIGDVFVPVDNDSAEAIDGSDKIPGACMQVLLEDPIVSEPTLPPAQASNIRPIGIADLLQVQQTIKRYVPGEIAHVENVMIGESKQRVHRQSTRIVEARLLETETVKEDSRDLQTAERFELQQEAANVIREESSREVGVSISGSYGPFAEGTANLNFSHANTSEESTKNATRYSREVTDKAVHRTQERVLERRSVTTEREFEETNTHSLSNTDDQHVVGIYRWVDKIYQAQVVSYGLRTIFEFVVPEPAALYVHSLTVLPREGQSVQRPDPPGYCLLNTETFASLTPNDIDESYYQFWVSKYGATGVTPPPARFKTIGMALSEETTDADGPVTISNEELQAPAGYRAVRAWIKGEWATTDPPQSPHFLTFHVGRTHIPTHASGPMNGEEGVIPLAGHGYGVVFFSVTVEVLCERSQELYAAWQMETFNAIIDAYNDKKSQHDAEMSRLAAQEEPVIGGRPPQLNREVERTELKRAAISMLTQQHFDDFDAMRRGVPFHGYPQMDVDEARAEGNYIQFFEQAFEWANSTYRFYPYFWGRKADWPKYVRLDDADPVFAKFLQAGAARIQVPVRPGFERAIVSLLAGNRPWEDNGTFSIDHTPYDAMLEELDNEQRGAFARGVGTISVEQGSHVITGSGTDFDGKLHTDRSILIANSAYRIKDVVSATELSLDEPYRGATQEDVPYAFGARLVGDPWEVRIPTNLVYLQEGNELPDFSAT
jgi:hypothetical protein